MTMATSDQPALAVVAPGSVDDPFSTNNPAVAAEFGVPAAPGNPVVAATGTPAEPVQNPATPAQTPVVSGVPAAPVAPLTAEQVEAMLTQRITDATKGLERRISTQAAENKALKDQVATVERQRVEEVRQAQLTGIPERDRAQLVSAWANEDRETALKDREAKVFDFYKDVEGMRLIQTYGDVGLVEDDILGCTTVEDMEKVALQKAVEFYRTGGQSQKQATASAAAKAATAPAGASAQADIGSGGAIGDNGSKMLTGHGLEDMSANIKSLFNDGGPNRPW